LRSGPAEALRLICLPYAGAGAAIFRSWPAALPPEIGVCAVQLPGREDRYAIPPYTSLPALAAAAADAIGPHLERPVAFFGHSMGALLAFELARRLRARTWPAPVHLFVSAFRAPHLRDRRPPLYELPAAGLLAELKRLNGMKAEVLEQPELLELIVPVLRADLRVVQTYTHCAEAPLHMPLTAYGGTSDPDIGPEELEAWREHTTGAFAVKMLPGDHFFLHTAESALLDDIAQRLRMYRPPD
jgi:medium-chain acyl-[acyl-carrier-protein] hydrolase